MSHSTGKTTARAADVLQRLDQHVREQTSGRKSLDDVLRPFVRLEASRSRESGGTGLGLAIASNLVAAQGGTLTLANRPEGGLDACIALPRPTA